MQEILKLCQIRTAAKQSKHRIHQLNNYCKTIQTSNIRTQDKLKTNKGLRQLGEHEIPTLHDDNMMTIEYTLICSTWDHQIKHNHHHHRYRKGCAFARVIYKCSWSYEHRKHNNNALALRKLPTQEHNLVLQTAPTQQHNLCVAQFANTTTQPWCCPSCQPNNTRIVLQILPTQEHTNATVRQPTCNTTLHYMFTSLLFSGVWEHCNTTLALQACRHCNTTPLCCLQQFRNTTLMLASAPICKRNPCVAIYVHTIVYVSFPSSVKLLKTYLYIIL